MSTNEEQQSAQGSLHQVIPLQPKRTDAEIAKCIRDDLTNKLNVVCKTLDAAKIDGFEVSFQLAKDGNGRQFISTLVIAKHF